jgi:hypothetical protein
VQHVQVISGGVPPQSEIKKGSSNSLGTLKVNGLEASQKTGSRSPLKSVNDKSNLRRVVARLVRAIGTDPEIFIWAVLEKQNVMTNINGQFQQDTL